MKHMLFSRASAEGFALPTIILASVIMMVVLVTSVTAVGSMTAALAGQYYGQLAREASESGLAHASNCLKSSNLVPTWTVANPLRPNTDCTGTVLPSASQWIVNSGTIRTSYTVGLPDTGAAGAVRVVADGKVDLVRGSNASNVWRTYNYTAAENSRYNDMPQIAGGAGFQEAGHNGYMLASNGTLYGWGDNSGYQLGDVSIGATISSPIVIGLPDGVKLVSKVFNSGQGASILCILAYHETLNSQVYCRGSESFGVSGWQRFALTAGLQAVDVVVNGYGTNNVCVKASDLQAYCAGQNAHGRLGNGAANENFVPYTSPMKFRLDLASPGPVSGSASSLTVKKIYSQSALTCVIASDDKAYCAGQNNFGQLGQGGNPPSTPVGLGKSVPGRALTPVDRSVIDISLPYHGANEGVFYQLDNGNIYMSGSNHQGTANGNASSTSPLVITLGNYGKMISVGERGTDQHAICVIAAASEMVSNSGFYCTGRNTYGQIGLANSTCTNPNRTAWTSVIPMGLPTQRVSPNLNAEALYQMNSVTVITANGDAYAAGDNTYGKLGTGTSFQACNPTFTRVALPSGVKAVAVANGDEYSTFILGDNGKVYAMGRNNNGQLGDGTTINRNAPVEVKVPRQATIY